MSGQVLHDPVLCDPVLEEDDGPMAHIVKVGPGEVATAVVLEARVTGTPVEALCGKVWVPQRDPRQLPPCSRCVDVFEAYRAVNDGLKEPKE